MGRIGERRSWDKHAVLRPQLDTLRYIRQMVGRSNEVFAWRLCDEIDVMIWHSRAWERKFIQVPGKLSAETAQVNHQNVVNRVKKESEPFGEFVAQYQLTAREYHLYKMYCVVHAEILVILERLQADAQIAELRQQEDRARHDAADAKFRTAGLVLA